MSRLKYIKFSELPVFDQDRALAFYTQKLGLHVGVDAPYQDGLRWIELEVPGAETRVLFTPKGDTDHGHEPRLVFVAEDIEATCRHLTDHGVELLQHPARAPWDPTTTFALFKDSEGNTIMLGSK